MLRYRFFQCLSCNIQFKGFFLNGRRLLVVQNLKFPYFSYLYECQRQWYRNHKLFNSINKTIEYFLATNMRHSILNIDFEFFAILHFNFTLHYFIQIWNLARGFHRFISLQCSTNLRLVRDFRFASNQNLYTLINYKL